MRTLTLTIVFMSLMASGCMLFGKKLVVAGEYDDESDMPPHRTSEELSECFEAVGVGREGLNVADRNVLHMACGDDMYGSSAASARIGVEEYIYSEVDIDPVYHGLHLILCSMDAKMEKYYHIMEKCRLSYEFDWESPRT